MHCEEPANCQLSQQKARILPTANMGFLAIKFPSCRTVTNFIPTPTVIPAVWHDIPVENFPRRFLVATWESLNCISTSVFSSTSTDNSWPCVIMRTGPSTSIAPKIGVMTDADDDDDDEICEVCEADAEAASCSRRCLNVNSHNRVTSARSSATRSVDNISIVICQTSTANKLQTKLKCWRLLGMYR